jgi:putative dehydrogenase
MSITVAILAQGTMGSGVGKRLHESGAEVRTLLGGRSAESAERARAAGMKPMEDEKRLLDGADFFLSILPPGEAENLARRLAPALSALAKKPIYVDCNAISPQTAQRIAAIIEPTGARFVEGGIIGGPPRPGYSGPAIYASGAAVGETAVLRDWGLDWRAIDGPIGAASGLKMSYAGITKGITALGSAMMLGAARLGCAEALIAELSSSQPQIFEYLSASIPRMYDKAYRWVA